MLIYKLETYSRDTIRADVREILDTLRRIGALVE